MFTRTELVARTEDEAAITHESALIFPKLNIRLYLPRVSKVRFSAA